MPFTHPTHVRARALALAGVYGSEEASRRTGVPGKRIRLWMEEAGRPEVAIPAVDLENAQALALATLTSDIAEGRLKGTQLAVATGILTDKVDRARRRAELTATDPNDHAARIEAERAAIYEWARANLPPEDLERTHRATADALRLSLLLADQPADLPASVLDDAIDHALDVSIHAAETLVNGGEPDPAAAALADADSDEEWDFVEWAKRVLAAIVEQYGSLSVWVDEVIPRLRAEERARREAEWPEGDRRRAEQRATAPVDAPGQPENASQLPDATPEPIAPPSNPPEPVGPSSAWRSFGRWAEWEDDDPAVRRTREAMGDRR